MSGEECLCFFSSHHRYEKRWDNKTKRKKKEKKSRKKKGGGKKTEQKIKKMDFVDSCKVLETPSRLVGCTECFAEYKQWGLHNCGNTTEATTLLQQFIKKREEKHILCARQTPPPRHENKVRGVRVRGPGSGLFSQGVGWG